MKRTITYFVGCLAILCLLASCNSKNVLMKRHYMKGYYFSHTDKKSDVSAHVKQSSRPALHTLPGATSGKAVNNTANPVVQQQGALTAAQNVKAQPQDHALIRSFKSKPLRKIYTLNPVSIGKEIKNTAFKPVARDDSGLSLFWIVILILLILWAIGWLTGGFGLGNVIHLLLIIALVLLILWLLHII